MAYWTSGLRLDIACGTGFVVETGFFCIYTCLFIAALPTLTSARRLKDARSAKSSWVFLIFSVLMYMVATLHLIFSGVRFYNSTYLDPTGTMAYLLNFNKWEFMGMNVLVCIQTWLGDVLVIYRCYFIWDNNLWLISVPACLLLGTIGLNLLVLYMFRHPTILAPEQAIGILNSIYPLAFVQNFMTTALIILKISMQHRASKKAGVVNVGSKLSLIRILRIVIESVAIYTILILVLNILYFRRDNFQFVIQPAIIPSIGITFVLLALRIEASRHENAATNDDLGIRSSMMPQWLREFDHEIGSQDSRGAYALPVVDSTALAEQKSAVQERTVGEYQWDSEFSPNSTGSLSSSKNGSACTPELRE